MKTALITISATPEQKARLVSLAEKESRSLSSYIMLTLESAIKGKK